MGLGTQKDQIEKNKTCTEFKPILLSGEHYSSDFSLNFMSSQSDRVINFFFFYNSITYGKLSINLKYLQNINDQYHMVTSCLALFKSYSEKKYLLLSLLLRTLPLYTNRN